MNIDTKAMVSITDANHNFSKVTKTVSEFGYALILKNNEPAFLITDIRGMDDEYVEGLVEKASAKKNKN